MSGAKARLAALCAAAGYPDDVRALIAHATFPRHKTGTRSSAATVLPKWRRALTHRSGRRRHLRASGSGGTLANEANRGEAMQNINRAVLTGNLTKDPELREFPAGGGVCSLRLAVNGRRKNPQTGEWEDQPGYFDISVFGAQGQNCARYLTKGRAVAIDGRLRWREFTRQDGSKDRPWTSSPTPSSSFQAVRTPTAPPARPRRRRKKPRPDPRSMPATSTPGRYRPGRQARTTSRSDADACHQRRAPRLRSQAARRRVPGRPRWGRAAGRSSIS